MYLDIHYEVFNSFKEDPKKTGGFLREYLSPKIRDAYNELKNNYSKDSEEIKNTLEKNRNVLNDKRSSMSPEVIQNFEESIKKSEGLLNHAKERFKTRQLKFKNDVFDLLMQKKSDDMFIKRVAEDDDYWATRRVYMERLLRTGSQIFVVDVSNLLDTWNETTFQSREVSEIKINKFLERF
jgi:hypothetical protein